MACNEVLHNKLNDSARVRVRSVMEVEAVRGVLNIDAPFVRIVAQYELLKVQESSLVGDALAYLHLRGPFVGCE